MLNGPRSRIFVEGLRASLVLLAIAAIPLAVAYGIGSTLPEEHSATATAIIQAPPPRVWELLTDFSAQVNWRKGPIILVRGPRNRGKDDPCWLEGWLLLKMTLCSAEEVKNRRRVVETVDDWLPFASTWTYELSPDEASSTATRLSVTQQSTIDPPLWRFIGRYILRQKTGVNQFLREVQVEAIRRP